jgi:hypothetical protein
VLGPETRKSWYEMTETGPHLAPLLRAAAQGRHDVRLADLDDRAIRWAVETGLGPLLFDVTRDDVGREVVPLWPLVHSAYLTSRLVGEGQQEATAEMLDACFRRGCALTLLKGISIAHQHYPEPALRPMRDIDVLVREADVPAAEAALAGLGYRQHSGAPARFYERHHHTMPFFDSRRGVWVEVHRRLSSPRPGRAAENVLDPAHVLANLEPADFLGRSATRLTSELQLVYTASHWASRFQVVGGATGLLDAIYLLKATAGTLRWDLVLAWLDRAPSTAAHLYALLTYLARHGLVTVPPAIVAALGRRQRSFGAMNLHLVHALIDRFLLGGAPPGRLLSEDRLRIVWNTLFLPGSPSRNLARLPWRLLPRRRASLPRSPSR